MTDLSFSERLSALIDIVFSSPFFIILFSFMVLTIVVFSVYTSTKSKTSRLVFSVFYILILMFLFLKYGTLMINLFDSFMDEVFMAIYFPNLFTYICMVVITSIVMIITIISRKIRKFIRISTIFSFTVIQFLFILTLDFIGKYNISLFEKTSLYSNETLMILIQSSMAIFSCFVGLLIMNLIINLISSKVPNNVIEIGQKKEELDYLSDEDFYNGFINYTRKKQYQEYSNINRN